MSIKKLATWHDFTYTTHTHIRFKKIIFALVDMWEREYTMICVSVQTEMEEKKKSLSQIYLLILIASIRQVSELHGYIASVDEPKYI